MPLSSFCFVSFGTFHKYIQAVQIQDKVKHRLYILSCRIYIYVIFIKFFLAIAFLNVFCSSSQGIRQEINYFFCIFVFNISFHFLDYRTPIKPYGLQSCIGSHSLALCRRTTVSNPGNFYLFLLNTIFIQEPH